MPRCGMLERRHQRPGTAGYSICKREAAKTGAVQTEADRAALAQAEQAVEDTREVVKLVQAEADATRIHQTIIRYTEIARALGRRASGRRCWPTGCAS